MSPSSNSPAQGDLLRLEEKAKRGDSNSQFKLAKAHETGEFGAQDMEEAVYWYRKAASQNHPGALNKFGEICEEGRYAERNLNKAVGYYQRAYELGSMKGGWNLATKLEKGIGVAEDKPESTRIFEELAGRGFYMGQCSYGRALMYGIGTEINYDQAVQNLKLCLEQEPEYRSALFMLGQCTLNGDGTERNVKAAMDLMTKAAQQDHKLACYTVGCEYEEGTNIRANLDKALYWFKRGAKLGDQLAKDKVVEVTNKLANSPAGPTNQAPANQAPANQTPANQAPANQATTNQAPAYQAFANQAQANPAPTNRPANRPMQEERTERESSNRAPEAENNARSATAPSKPSRIEELESAANAGDPSAQFQLGRALINGEVVQKDVEKAIFWFRKAAATGFADAQAELGEISETGRAGKVEIDKAIRWYQNAIEQNVPKAQFRYGMLLLNGNGADDDVQEGKYLIQAAAQQGFGPAYYRVWSLSLVYGRSKDYDQGVKYIQRALETCPQDPTALYVLADCTLVVRSRKTPLKV